MRDQNNLVGQVPNQNYLNQLDNFADIDQQSSNNTNTTVIQVRARNRGNDNDSSFYNGEYSNES